MLLWDPIMIIILIKFEINLKIYVEATRYLAQVSILQEFRKHLNWQ